MRTMKDSGVEWIGEIPVEWRIEKGKHVLSYLERLVKETDCVVTCFRDGQVTLRSNRRELGFTVSLQEIGYKGVEPGDLVVHGMDGFAGSIGISDSRGKCSPVLNILDSNENKTFLMYYLRVMAYGNVFLALSTGIRERTCDTNWNKLKELPYPVPSKEEQDLIANNLDTKCAEIDKVVEQTRTTIEEYKKLKQAIITEAVTKGVRGPRPMKPSGVEWIGDIPEEWEVKRIKYVVSLRNDKGVYNPSQDKYIGLENIVGFSDILVETGTTYAESEYQVCRAGDVMYSRLRPYLGKSLVCPIDGFCTGELMLFSSFHGERRYLRYWFLNELVTAVIVQSTYGTKMPRANPNYILNLPIILPDATEQQEIAAYLDTKCAEIDRIIGKKEQLIEELGSYKKSLIYEYVTGKKQVLYK